MLLAHLAGHPKDRCLDQYTADRATPHHASAAKGISSAICFIHLAHDRLGIRRVSVLGRSLFRFVCDGRWGNHLDSGVLAAIYRLSLVVIVRLRHDLVRHRGRRMGI